MQELGRTTTALQTLFLQDGFKHICMSVAFHFWVHELLISLKTWASGEVPWASKI